MSGRKRKADDDLPDRDRMSYSPSPVPATLPAPYRSPTQTQPLAIQRAFKRPRATVTGRPLALSRLLETLSAEEMRSVLRSICENHPAIGSEIAATAPRPSVQSATSVLKGYLQSMRQAFPYGNKPTSEYTFNRVRSSLLALLEALNDFTPHFLPPNETHAATSLDYLEGATNIIHELPNWDSFQHDRYKQEAYEEIAKSWACVIREAAKRGGGIQLQMGGWDRKLAAHDETSGGRMKEALAELRRSTGWFNSGMNTGQNDNTDTRASVREQLLNGTYGASAQILIGPW